jgi:hypothetical protein
LAWSPWAITSSPALTAAASAAWSPSAVVDERDVLVPGLDAEPEPLGGVDPRVVESPRPDIKAGELSKRERKHAEGTASPRAAHDPLRVDLRGAQISEVREHGDRERSEDGSSGARTIPSACRSSSGFAR